MFVVSSFFCLWYATSLVDGVVLVAPCVIQKVKLGVAGFQSRGFSVLSFVVKHVDIVAHQLLMCVNVHLECTALLLHAAYGFSGTAALARVL